MRFSALRIANQRFQSRFIEMLKISNKNADEFSLLSDQEKEKLWELAKKNLD
jgi:uncharacterized protein YabN with tetrapyrrole methylase and pyrophosphatase domain